MKLARIALRNVGRNRRRSVLSATATAVATMAMVAFAAFINGMKADMQQNVADMISGHVRVRHKEFDRYERLNPLHLRIERPEDLLAALDQDPAVAASVARLPLPVGIFRAEETVGAQAVGMDMDREERYMKVSTLVSAGRLPRAGAAEAVVGSDLAKKLGVKPGDRITLLASTMRRSTNALTLDVVGLAAFPVASMNGSTLLFPLDRAIALARTDGGVAEVLVKARDPGRVAAVRDGVSRILAEGGWSELGAKTWTEASPMLAYLDMGEAIYFGIGIVFFLLASTVLINTTMMVVFERTREIGTVGALGMKGREIVGMFFLEALYLAAIGALVGVAAGIAITVPLSLVGMDMSSALQGVSFDISNVIHARPKLLSTALILVYAVAISCLAALLPARRAAKIQPVEALRAI